MQWFLSTRRYECIVTVVATPQRDDDERTYWVSSSSFWGFGSAAARQATDQRMIESYGRSGTSIGVNCTFVEWFENC